MTRVYLVHEVELQVTLFWAIMSKECIFLSRMVNVYFGLSVNKSISIHYMFLSVSFCTCYEIKLISNVADRALNSSDKNKFCLTL